MTALCLRLLGGVVVGGLACTGLPLLAQSADPKAERVGPNASQTVPAFPVAAPFAVPSARDVPVPVPVNSGTVTIGDVAVDADREGTARAVAGWPGEADRLTGLRLSLAPGEAMDAAWIRRQFADNAMIGAPVRLDQVVGLVQLINRAFIANGYINSGVLVSGAPPADGGTLRLRLVPGRLVAAADGAPALSVEWGKAGSNRLSEQFIANRMAAAEEVPLNAGRIEQQFRLLAENPAIRTINADLIPGTRPGEARLRLTVEPQPLFDVYMVAANNRSPSIGGERYAFGALLRNALRPGDTFSGEVGRTAGKYDFAAGYEVPFLDTRTLLSVRGGRNEAAVIDPQLAALNINATDWNVEAGIARIVMQRPLSPRGDGKGWQSSRTVKIGVSYAHRHSVTELLGQPFSFAPGAVDGRTEYSALRLSADYVERGIASVLIVSLTASQGLDGTRGDIPGLVTPDTGFRSLRGQLSYARRLNTGRLELRFRVAGQWTDGIVYSGERFSAGGADTVRGYRETLVLADTGVNASAELVQHFTLSPRSARKDGFDWGAFSVSAFVDGAYLHNRAGAPAVPDHIASLGASLAWTPSPAISAVVTYAKALKEVTPPGVRDLQDRGVAFRVVVRPFDFFRN